MDARLNCAGFGFSDAKIATRLKDGESPNDVVLDMSSMQLYDFIGMMADNLTSNCKIESMIMLDWQPEQIANKIGFLLKIGCSRYFFTAMISEIMPHIVQDEFPELIKNSMENFWFSAFVLAWNARHSLQLTEDMDLLQIMSIVNS